MIISAIKIDVVKKEVYQVEIENNLEGLYEAIECEIVECVRINQSNDLWLDEEGRLQLPSVAKIFVPGMHQYVDRKRASLWI